jgi:hypothetical protein
MRDEKLTAHLTTIKELEAQLDQRAQRLREVQRDKEADELRASYELSELREKLETANDRILVLSSNEETIKVYQKRIETMA